ASQTYPAATRQDVRQWSCSPAAEAWLNPCRKSDLCLLAQTCAGSDLSTVASELAYAGSVLRHAAREGHHIDADAPGKARTALDAEGIRIVSKQRTKRLTDAELSALREWIAANAKRTHLPLSDIVEFALATGLRRGEILALEWS